MKYIVTRTSCLGYDQKPCEEAVKEILTDVDERTIDDPMKNKLIGERWYTEEGYFNHRVENGHIKRDLVVVPSYTAKGLEFDSVIIYNDIDNKYTKEDKYLYYVACTRAQHNLIIYNGNETLK